MLQRLRRVTVWLMYVAIILVHYSVIRPIMWIARVKWRISRWFAGRAFYWGRTPSFAVLTIIFAAFFTLYTNFDSARAGTSNLNGGFAGGFSNPGQSDFSSSPTNTGNRTAQGGQAHAGGVSDGETAINQKQALLLNKLLLEKACANLIQVGDYTATFSKHERVQGSLLPPEVMEVKIREKPFSVYMRWHVGDKGRELLYVHGENDNNLLVHPGGWQGNMISALSISRDSNLAMKENRYPIDKVGLMELSKILLSYRDKDLAGETGAVVTVMDEREFEGQPCYCFVIEYPERERSPEYRKSILMLDKVNCLPIFCKNYTWPEEGSTAVGNKLDEETLLEFYTYTNLKLGPQLADKDFDRNNVGYEFQ
ncbi:MAG: DUF1571 domain-containing protein [Planctomycetaceae bacterium]